MICYGDMGEDVDLVSLMRSSVPMVEWFYMYKCNRETVDHLFLCCEVTYSLCGFIFFVVGVELVLQKCMFDLLIGWRKVI